MSDLKDFVIEDGVLKEYNGTDKYVTIPEGVKVLDSSVFYKNKNVESIVVPEGVTEIKSECFAECRNLIQLSLPNSLVTIGIRAFDFCVKLEKLEIPEKIVTDHFDLILKECWNLKEIVLPYGITVKKDVYLYEGAWLYLHGCNRLTSIVCPSISAEGIQEKRRFPATIGFLTNVDKYTDRTVAESYIKHFLKRKKLFLPEILSNDIVEGIKILADNKKITKKDIDAVYLEPAVAAGATQCIAFLLNWKQENIGLFDDLSLGGDCIVKKAPAKRKSPKVDEDPFSERNMKKLWRYRLTENNTLCLYEYRGDEENVVVPNRIGNYSVEIIHPNTFLGYVGRGGNQRNRAIARIVSVEVMDGVKEIQNRAFYGCQSLKAIKLPDSIKKISAYKVDADTKMCISGAAFEHCPNLTIHAAAGSYAEQYAKENNIPFAVEE